jgi:hypothetical protein
MANAQKDQEAPHGTSENDDNPTLFESISNGPELKSHIEEVEHFLDRVKKGYKKDTLFTKIVKEEERYSSFTYREGLLYTNNHGGHEVLCIPRIITRD